MAQGHTRWHVMVKFIINTNVSQVAAVLIWKLLVERLGVEEVTRHLVAPRPH